MIECVLHYLKTLKNNNETKSVAILAPTNNTVSTMFAVLESAGEKPRALIKEEGFKLRQLVEICEFKEYFEFKNDFFNAKECWLQESAYKESQNFELAKEVIEKFEDEYAIDEDTQYDDHQQKYWQHCFHEYLYEISFEEFEQGDSRLIVSTIHKAKGKEFDTVFLCDDYVRIKEQNNDYNIRALYVGITRAKSNLFVHTMNPELFAFEDGAMNNVSRVQYTVRNSSNSNTLLQKVFTTGLSDIYIVDIASRKEIITDKIREGYHIVAGAVVSIDMNRNNRFKQGDSWAVIEISQNEKTLIIGSFSKAMKMKIQDEIKKGYEIDSEKCKIRHVVEYLHKNEAGAESLQHLPLCDIYLKKKV